MNKKEIASRLIKARGALSQRDAAKLIKISRSALSMYESGARIPKDDIKIKISKAYGISVQDLFYCTECHERGQ